MTLTGGEFTKVLHHLNKSAGVFAKAHTLRDRMKLDKDDGDTVYLEFFDSADPLRNRYQVTQQVKMEGSYKNRYDVTILVNGLPLVQIELKRRGLEMKEAFNQIQRYQKHTFWSGHGLFHFVQLFVISNGVNTKYYANARKQSFKQTFYWAQEDNTTIRELTPFRRCLPEPRAPWHDDRQVHRAERDRQDPDGAAPISVLRHRGDRGAGEEPAGY